MTGKEFGDTEGHTLVIVKALCRLRNGGQRFHSELAFVFKQIKIKPSKAEPDVWLKDGGCAHKHIVACVDNLQVTMRKPTTFFQTAAEQFLELQAKQS